MARRFTLPITEVQNSSGAVGGGWKLEFFITGTSTPLDNYSDNALTTANNNPIAADSGGRFGNIFLKDAEYKVTLSDAADVQIWSADPVHGGDSTDLVTATGATNARSLADLLGNGDETITVGSGGDFSTINDALADLTARKPSYKSGLSVEISLLSGFTMAEQVIVDGLDLGWITITSVDSTVSVTTASITAATIGTRKAVFAFRRGAVSPYIKVIFDAGQAGTSDDDFAGFFVDNSTLTFDDSGSQGSPVAGFRNLNGRALYVIRNGRANVTDGSFSGNMMGMRASNQGLISAENVTISNCDTGVTINDNSLVLLQSGKGTSCTVDAINCTTAGIVDAQSFDGSSAGSASVRITAGGTVSVRSYVADGSLTGFDIAEGATIKGLGASAEGCGIALQAQDSRISMRNLDAQNATTAANEAVQLIDCIADLRGLNVSGAVAIGLRCQRSIVNAQGLTASSCGTFGASFDNAGTRVNIDGSTLQSNTTDDIQIATDAIVYGRSITTTAGSPALADITGATTFNHYQEGIGALFTNIKTVNDGTATVTNGNTTVVVTHSLGLTPDLKHISVTPTNNLGNATKFFISTVTSTQFTINVDQDPGATTATFVWMADMIN